MCEICRQHPCHPACPNADEEPVIANCVDCGRELYEGDKVFKGVCEDCMRDYSVDEVLCMCGESFETLGGIE